MRVWFKNYYSFGKQFHIVIRWNWAKPTPFISLFMMDFIVSRSNYNYTQLIFITYFPIIALSLKNDELYYINNHDDNYYFSSITDAIKNKILAKDQSLKKAWVDSLLIKNPDVNKVAQFIKSQQN